MVLHEDSALMWYNERDDGSPQGGILLKDAPEMIAVGQVSSPETRFSELCCQTSFVH